MIRPRDYQEGGCVEAPSPYAAWSSLQGTEAALQVGDLLEREDGALCICKYVGFDEARWIVAETPAV